jgi:PAS domain S-box-containing protein
VLRHRIEHLVQSRRAWQALQASEERFRQVVASITDHIYVTEITADNQLINHYVSPNVENLVGYSLENVLADWGLWARSIHPDDQLKSKQQLDALLTGHSSEVEYRVTTAAGKTIWVRDSARVEQVNDKTFIYGVVSNITARKRAEESIRSSQKLAELGTLAAGVAHEINSPLQVITGVSEGLLKRHQEDRLNPEFLCRKLEVIQRNGWRCAEIVRSLKTYAYTAPTEMQAQDLNHIIKDTLLLIEHQLNSWSNITVETQLADDLPSFFCDRNQITQIIINLLINARDAMPDGGKITIGTRPNAANNTLELRLADTGHGIPPTIQPKIFDPFFTTKSIDKGTGLGLSIIAGIVKAHGGAITLNSAPDAGTEFVITFSYASKPAAAQMPLTGSGRFDDVAGPIKIGEPASGFNLILGEL